MESSRHLSRLEYSLLCVRPWPNGAAAITVGAEHFSDRSPTSRGAPHKRRARSKVFISVHGAAWQSGKCSQATIFKASG
jgi:hypothetical protein